MLAFIEAAPQPRLFCTYGRNANSLTHTAHLLTPQEWDKWLDGRPLSECGCLPDLAAAVVLLEHLQATAAQAAEHCTPTASKGRPARKQAHYRGHPQFDDDWALEPFLQADPVVVSRGWRACVSAFCGTQLLEVGGDGVTHDFLINISE